MQLTSLVQIQSTVAPDKYKTTYRRNRGQSRISKNCQTWSDSSIYDIHSKTNETGGPWISHVIKLIRVIGRRLATTMSDPLDTQVYLSANIRNHLGWPSGCFSQYFPRRVNFRLDGTNLVEHISNLNNFPALSLRDDRRKNNYYYYY